MIQERSSTVDWEKDIYEKGLQLNHWPYTEVISDILNATNGSDRRALRLLEIGCGAGNNLWFAAEAGFKVYGLDSSPTAIKYASARLWKMGHKEVDLRVGSLTSLPWPENFFDIVLDRGALTQNSYSAIRVCLREVHRVLRPHVGRLLAYTLYGLDHEDRKYGIEVSRNTYDHFSDGYFKGVGLTSFFSAESLSELFVDFDQITIKRYLSENLSNRLRTESYSISCRKKDSL